MAKRISKEKRSHIMSCIKSKNTRVELILRRKLWARGLRYKLHAELMGKPDVVFKTKKVAVFIDGDFWHGYDFKNLKPKLKNKFWLDKIRKNMKRDRIVSQTLQKQGYAVIRLWEHQIKKDLSNCVELVEGAVR